MAHDMHPAATAPAPPTRPPLHRRAAALARRAALPVLGLLLLAALALLAWRQGPWAPVRVTVAAVDSGSVQPELFGIGTVEARRSYTLGPTQAGRLLQVQADVGDRVRAGQVLARMDPVDLDARVQALDAGLLRAGSAAAAVQAQQQDARARLALARSQAERDQALLAQGFYSASAWQMRQQELASAQAAADAGAANAQAATQDRQRLAAERAALLRQQAHLLLRAPADAVVTAREAEPGSTVVAGQAVLRLVDPSSLWLRVRVDQGRSAGLAAGLPAQVLLRSRPDAALPGRVLRVEALADAVTEERMALVTLDTPPAGLSLGEIAEVSLPLPPVHHALRIPAASVQRAGPASGTAQQPPGQTGVWRLRDQRLEWAPVELGVAGADGQVQVLQGLQAGDTVVVHRARPLQAGQRVQVVSRLTAGAAP